MIYRIFAIAKLVVHSHISLLGLWLIDGVYNPKDICLERKFCVFLWIHFFYFNDDKTLGHMGNMIREVKCRNPTVLKRHSKSVHDMYRMLCFGFF